MTFRHLMFPLPVISAIFILAAACNKLDEHQLASPTAEHDADIKWLQFRDSLRLPSHPGPNLYLSESALGQEYQELLAEATARLTANIWQTKCAAIENLELYTEQKALDASKQPLEADVYIMDYRLQKNSQGEAEDQIRSGIITIPRKNRQSRDASGTFPLLIYNHGGDRGLFYSEISQTLDSLQTDYMTVSPSFPGEAIFMNNGIARPATRIVKHALWASDVHESLGMYDCIAKYSAMEQAERLHRVAPGSFKISDPEAFAARKLQLSASAKESLENLIFDKDKALSRLQPHSNFSSFYPKTIAVGSSRGGLVTSIAMAVAGAQLERIRQISNEKGQSLLQRFLFRHQADQYLDELDSAFGVKNFGMSLPMFSGISTIGAPSSVTVGSFRFILEHMVKGRGDQTVARNRPGIRYLLDLFEDYRTGKISADEARFRVILRDMTYLAPLMLAAVKNWNMPLLPGSVLLMHGDDDQVVPDEQTQVAANILINLSENDKIRSETLSPFGIQVMTRIFERHHDPDVCESCDLFHVNDCFFKSFAALPKNYFDPGTTRAWIHSGGNASSTKFAYSTYSLLNPDGLSPDEGHQWAHPTIKAYINDLLKILQDDIRQDLEQILKTTKDRKAKHLAVSGFLKQREQDIHKQLHHHHRHMKHKDLKEVGKNLLNTEDFDSERLRQLFSVSSTKELIELYRNDRQLQFAVETLLANGQRSFIKESGLPLLSWDGMNATELETEKAIRHSEQKTPHDFLKAWASGFSALRAELSPLYGDGGA